MDLKYVTAKSKFKRQNNQKNFGKCLKMASYTSQFEGCMINDFILDERL